MKTPFSKQILIALVVAAAVGISHDGLAQPDSIAPGTPLAEVVKLVQSGVDTNVISSYIANSPSAFNLDAEKIIYLNDLGVPTDLINAMMSHDRSVAAVAAATPPATGAPDTAPPPEVTVNYFNDNLSPYGSWIEVEGYGRCWRPTTVIYDSGWQPYCDRGHWVYSDCGWYWDSDYAWGATFHYGRWFRHSRFGWCWWPDTVWAPSWVTWRSGGEYCGWAPLPPFSVYRPGFGFLYRGASVGVGFDFGLEIGCFTFVTADHFSERHPRYYRADRDHAAQIFNRTTVINNYNFHNDNRTIFNGGISVDRINAATHHPIRPVAVGQIPNAGRQGWRGNDGAPRPTSGAPAGNSNPGHSLPAGGNQSQRGQTDANRVRQPDHGTQPVAPNRNGNETTPSHPQPPVQPPNQPGQRDNNIRTVTPPANNNFAPATPGNRNSQHNDSQLNPGERGQLRNQFNGQPRTPAPATPSAPPTIGQPSRNSQPQPPPVIRDQPRDNSVEAARHYNNPNPPAPSVPERSQPQPQSPPSYSAPHGSPPSTPAPSQGGSSQGGSSQGGSSQGGSSRGTDHSGSGSDKDRQNH